MKKWRPYNESNVAILVRSQESGIRRQRQKKIYKVSGTSGGNRTPADAVLETAALPLSYTDTPDNKWWSLAASNRGLRDFTPALYQTELNDHY
jgi:hypothetical protein